jgi:hypothetical protein
MERQVSMSRRLILLMATAGLALALVQVAAADQTFTDPTGDATGGAADVGNVSVANDTTTGTVTIGVQTNQNPLASGAFLIVLLNTDRNAGTGPLLGAEYAFVIDATGYDVLAWNGSDYVTSSATTDRVSFSAGTFTIQINKSDLGNLPLGAFDLNVLSALESGDQIVGQDLAPDAGAWTYTLATPPPPPPPPPTVSLGAATSKAGVHAGKAFSVSAPVTTDASSVKVTCTARANGHALRMHGSYARGRAICSGVAPAKTAGKRLTGTITASVTGDREAKAFSLPIRK